MDAAVRLRPMLEDDVAAVMDVERGSFETGWPKTAFERELAHNAMARYIVLESARGVIGFAGLWLMLDEAHIVTVAVLPNERRAGYGRLLVHGLILLAKSEGMQVATLEVRESNEAARALYRRYGFYEVGLRKRYYSDNGEDAVIMTTEELDSPAFMRRFAGLEEGIEERMPGALSPLCEAIGPAAG